MRRISVRAEWRRREPDSKPTPIAAGVTSPIRVANYGRRFFTSRFVSWSQHLVRNSLRAYRDTYTDLKIGLLTRSVILVVTKSPTNMRNPFYYVSLVTALILLVIIFIILNPDVDRHRGPMVIGLAIFVLAIHVVALVAYPFYQTRNFAGAVKAMGLLSMVVMLDLALFNQPNFEVRGVFKPLDSKAGQESDPSR